MDLVSICTPDQFHYHQIGEAIDHSIHVFCEKPLCISQESLADTLGHPFLKDIRLSMNMVMRARVPKTSGAYRIDAAYNWGRKEKLKGWRGDLPYHPILGGGVHLIDLMVRDLGQPVKVESYHRGLVTTTLLDFENGALGTLVSDLNSPPPHCHRYDVYIDDGHWVRQYGNWHKEPDELVQTSFIDSILHGTPAMVTEEDVFATMKVCFDALR